MKSAGGRSWLDSNVWTLTMYADTMGLGVPAFNNGNSCQYYTS